MVISLLNDDICMKRDRSVIAIVTPDIDHTHTGGNNLLRVGFHLLSLE